MAGRGLGTAVSIALMAALAPRGNATVCLEGLSGGMIFPADGGQLSRAGWLIIDGSDRRPNWSTAAYELRSASEHVPLRVEQAFGSSGSVYEVMLRARRTLLPATDYALFVNGKPANPKDYHEFEHSREVAWTTARQEDRAAPRWSGRPRVTRPEHDTWTDVDLAVPVVDAEGPVHMLIDIRPLGSTVPDLHLVLVDDGEISLSTECGGIVSLDPGKSYSIELTAVDTSGNRSPPPGGRLKLVVPRQAKSRP
jgi:hypothetical protein